MSYYATIDGAFEISHGMDLDKLLDMIDDSSYSNAIEIISEDADGFTLVFDCYGDYKEDEIIAFLKEIEPHTISGEIDYYAEGNEFWRHYFIPGKGWVEQYGFIKYEARYRTIESMSEKIKAAAGKGDAYR